MLNLIQNKIFYAIKPLIPRPAQISLRRKLAGIKRANSNSIWPIDPNSANPPKGWQGWPEGKKFALVFSHDVDTGRGYKQVLKLAELEEKLGFRSCFNFVPERYGQISLGLLGELRRRGFGVGVHGLKHDGTLFLSKNNFEHQAARINTYLEKWNTKGFTSPSMHHKHEWMSALNIEYSTSTFDTDPFEPQPDGAGTIFPFLVLGNSAIREGNRNQGPSTHLPTFFVELPYTLPQDFTLFVILSEKKIDLWTHKLDWIAEKGGMALLNTHPDYMNFTARKCSMEEYPASYYFAFLDYIQKHYGKKCWHCLPEEVAGRWKETMVPRQKPGPSVQGGIT